MFDHLPKKRICFIDQRNIFRSNLAEHLFNCQVDTNLAKACSRGYDNTPPRYDNFSFYPEYRPCKEILKALGISYKFSHTNYQLIQPEDLNYFDLLVAMDRTARKCLLEMGCPEHKIVSSQETGISADDPVFGDEAQYRQTISQVDKIVQAVLKII